MSVGNGGESLQQVEDNRFDTSVGSALLNHFDGDVIGLDDVAPKDFVGRYVGFLSRNRRRIMSAWALMTLLGLIFAVGFLKEVVLKYEPPKGTPGQIANDKFLQEFEGMSHAEDTFIVFSRKDESLLFGEDNEEKARLNDFINRLNASVVDWGRNKCSTYTEFSLVHYFLLAKFGAMSAAGQLLDTPEDAQKARVMLASLSVVNHGGLPLGSMESNNFIDWLDGEIDKIKHSVYGKTTLEIRLTGFRAVTRDMLSGTESDMMKMDSLTFPFAFGVLAYMLNSFRLLVIPSVNILCTIATAFMIMYPVAVSTEVIAVCPSMMMSVSLAFSIDYSLFLLSRFREEVVADVPVRVATEVMVECAGHTILVSGLTIAVCWFGMIAFPVPLLSTSGLGCGVAVLVTLTVNITLTPALLLEFPDFFSKFYPDGLLNFKSCRKRKQEDEGYRNLLRQSSAQSLASPFQESLGRRASMLTPGSRVSMGNSSNLIAEGEAGSLNGGDGKVNPREEIEFLRRTTVWYGFAERCFGTKGKALGAVILCCCLIIPLAPFALDFHHTDSYKLFAPRGSESAVGMSKLQDNFGPGRVAPYSILVKANKSTSVLSDQFFEHMQVVIQRVLLNLDWEEESDFDAIKPSGIESPMYFHGHNVSLFPSHDKEKHLSIAECFFETVEDVVASCAADRCVNEVAACEGDKRCSRGLQCAKNCEGDVGCTAFCFASLRDTDFDTIKLGVCVVEKCIQSPFLLSGQNPSFKSLALRSTMANDEENARPDCPSLLVQFFQQVKIVEKNGRPEPSKYSWLNVHLNIAPFDTAGGEWLEKVRNAFKKQAQEDGYEYYISGGDVAGYDTVKKVFEYFPYVCAGIMLVVFCICTFAFRSLVVPLRAIFTICLTLCFSFGTGVLVYERHALDWTHFKGFSNPGGDALAWITTSMLMPISVGLSLDYDIFLLTRIFEYRKGSFNDYQSILCGLSQTGSVITAAGMVMAVAFSGLLLSSNSTLNQVSWFLVCCVLIDTFIVRTIIVPALMILLGEKNWWPSRFDVGNDLNRS